MQDQVGNVNSLSEPLSAIQERSFASALINQIENLVGDLLPAETIADLRSRILRKTEPLDELIQIILDRLHIRYEVPDQTLEALRRAEGPLILICNHPFGGIEALVLIQLLARLKENFRLVANALLKDLDEPEPPLIYMDPFRSMPASPTGEVSPAFLTGYLKEGGVLAIFPSDEIVETRFKKQKLLGQEWGNSIARIILLSEASFAPVYFHSKTSFIYRIAGLVNNGLRDRLHIRNLLNTHDRKVIFSIGSRIPPSRISMYKDPEQLNQFIKSRISLLSLRSPETEKNNRRSPEPADYGEPVIPAVPQKLLLQEIELLNNPAHLLVESSQFNVYCFLQDEAPNLMREIGRLRELTFREVGEGSGKACDIDRFDVYYMQLFLWDKKEECVVGGYRIGKLDQIMDTYGKNGIYSCGLFRIRSPLIRQIMPAIELGRSFVTLEYQKGYFSLLLLWNGICQYLVRNPHYRYIIGPVSISSEMNDISKSLLVRFLENNRMAENLQEWVKPRNRFKVKRKAKKHYNSFAINDLKEIQEAITELENNQMGVPILFKHYLKMGARMLAFNVDPEFSDVLDCLMMTDLTQSDRRLLRKYMGDEGLKHFLAAHGIEEG
jgi:putative hemolysin